MPDWKSKRIVTFFFFLALGISIFLGQQIISLSIANQARKMDYAEINNIKYGLFSINQWKAQLTDIINSEISELDVKDNEKQIRPMLQAQLHALIDSVYKRIKEKNQGSLKGKVKQIFIDNFVNLEDVKEGIPEYADAIIKLMEKPTAKRTLRNLLLDKVGYYFDKTFEEQDLTQLNLIVEKTGASDLAGAKIKLFQDMTKAQKQIFNLAWLLIGLSTLLFIVAGLSGDPLPSSQYIVLAMVLLVILLTGVTTPMIDLEAKISEMSFVLFDHPVKFLNQILYFQTKSIFDVFWIMIAHKDLQMKIVGVLMIAFSVIFPVFKLLFSVGYYYNFLNARENPWVQFFVLKSGKWSMTDVMIIAIFMAYIGFSGIIANQLGKLHSAEGEMVLLTTNGTSLQPGFYLFLSYTILAMVLAEILSRKLDPQPQAVVASSLGRLVPETTF